LLSAIERRFTPRQKRGNNKAITLVFTIHGHQYFAICLFFQGKQFSEGAGQNSFRLNNGFENIPFKTGEFGVFLGDVRPTFIGEANRCAAF
jgi:hypothetical protein